MWQQKTMRSQQRQYLSCKQRAGIPSSYLPMTASIAFVFVTLPWLNPFSPGPTAAVWPFLFSWVCAAMLWLALAGPTAPDHTRVMVRSVALAWLAAASVNASIGLLQYFGATAWAGQWINHTGLGEAYGNLRQRNQFATLMNIGLAALLWFAAKLHLPENKTTWPTLLAVASAVLLGAGNAASSSRTGLIQLLLLAALTGWWQHQTSAPQAHSKHLRPVNLILFVSLLAYAVALLALPLLAGLDPLASGAWARIRSGDALCSSRLTLWGNVLHLIAQKPWLGWGWGELDYAHFMTLYPGARFCDILDNAHNLPLHLAVELGVPLALLVCGTVAWLLWRTKPWRELDATRQMAWIVLAIIGLHSLLEYPLWYGPFQMAALLSVWLLWPAVPHQPQLDHDKHLKPKWLYLHTPIAITTVAVCGYVGWNYQLASQIYLLPAARMVNYQDDTLKKISKVAVFQDQVRFASLTTIELDAQNAQEVHDLALDMLHFSPEARVVELVLESGKLLGRAEEMRFFATRYQAAFPAAYAKWLATQPPP